MRKADRCSDDVVYPGERHVGCPTMRAGVGSLSIEGARSEALKRSNGLRRVGEVLHHPIAKDMPHSESVGVSFWRMFVYMCCQVDGSER